MTKEQYKQTINAVKKDLSYLLSVIIQVNNNEQLTDYTRECITWNLSEAEGELESCLKQMKKEMDDLPEDV